MSDTPPAVGAIRLFDAARPDLDAGLYRVTSALEIAQTSGGALTAPPPLQTHVRVGGPRFVLDDGEIATRHPPLNAKGAFWDRLPHVALGRRTLPWERPLADGTPWLAVLVVRANEGDLATGKLHALLPAAVVAALPDLPADDPTVTVLRMHDLATFKAILPSRDDVRLLAHVRRVNVADTELAGRDDDGDFAIVTANRLPLLTAGAVTTSYLGCVVSLEARDDVWTVPAGQSPPPLLVLASWTFTVSAVGGTFEEVARLLDVAPIGAPASGTPVILDANGTLGIDRVTRPGDRVRARYRGPLLGTHAGQPLGATDDDICVPAAFELGRLLGAADGRFLRELVAWHRAQEAGARTALVRADLAVTLAVNAAPRGVGPRVRAAADARSIETLDSAAVQAVLAERLAQHPRRVADLWQVHPAARALAAARAPRPEAKKRNNAAKKTRATKQPGAAKPARSVKRGRRRKVPR
jgi:hypothetical protein